MVVVAVRRLRARPLSTDVEVMVVHATMIRRLAGPGQRRGTNGRTRAGCPFVCPIGQVIALDRPVPPRYVDLRPGGAWVASSPVGLMTLIDGATAEVAARVDVGRPSSSLVATQEGPVG